MDRFIKCDPETFRLLALAKDHTGQFVLVFDTEGNPTFLGAIVMVEGGSLTMAKED